MTQMFEFPSQPGGKTYYEEKGYPEVYIETKIAGSSENSRPFDVDVISIDGETQIEINDILQKLDLYGLFCTSTDNYETVEVGPVTSTRLYCLEDVTKHVIVKEGTRVIHGPNVGYKLETIDLPSTVTEIDLWSFGATPRLKRVIFHDNQTIILRQNAFADSFYLEQIKGLNPAHIKHIEEEVFRKCLRLVDVPIPNNCYVTSIPERYAEQTACKTLSIPDNIKCIERAAFACCHDLESVYIMEGCERICAEAFFGCDSLTIVKIPDSVKKIYENTFEKCGMFTVVCNPGSYAEYWANMMKIHVEHSGTL